MIRAPDFIRSVVIPKNIDYNFRGVLLFTSVSVITNLLGSDSNGISCLYREINRCLKVNFACISSIVANI